MEQNDPINPSHYRGLFQTRDIQCIAMTRCLDFCLGNYVKYIYRCGNKDNPVQDFNKAKWYANDWITHHHERDVNGLLINPCGKLAAVAFDFIEPPEEGTELRDRYELMRIVTLPYISGDAWRRRLRAYEDRYLVDKGES